MKTQFGSAFVVLGILGASVSFGQSDVKVVKSSSELTYWDSCPADQLDQFISDHGLVSYGVENRTALKDGGKVIWIKSNDTRVTMLAEEVDYDKGQCFWDETPVFITRGEDTYYAFLIPAVPVGQDGATLRIISRRTGKEVELGSWHITGIPTRAQDSVTFHLRENAATGEAVSVSSAPFDYKFVDSNRRGGAKVSIDVKGADFDRYVYSIQGTATLVDEDTPTAQSKSWTSSAGWIMDSPDWGVSFTLGCDPFRQSMPYDVVLSKYAVVDRARSELFSANVDRDAGTGKSLVSVDNQVVSVVSADGSTTLLKAMLHQGTYVVKGKEGSWRSLEIPWTVTSDDKIADPGEQGLVFKEEVSKGIHVSVTKKSILIRIEPGTETPSQFLVRGEVLKLGAPQVSTLKFVIPYFGAWN